MDTARPTITSFSMKISEITPLFTVPKEVLIRVLREITPCFVVVALHNPHGYTQALPQCFFVFTCSLKSSRIQKVLLSCTVILVQKMIPGTMVSGPIKAVIWIRPSIVHLMEKVSENSWNMLKCLLGFILFARIFVRFHDEMQCWWATKKARVEWRIVCKDDMNQSKSPTILELFQNCEVKKCGVSQKKLEALVMPLIDVHIHPVFPPKIGIQGTKPCSHWDWPLSHWWKPRNPNSPTYKRLESKSSSFWPIASVFFQRSERLVNKLRMAGFLAEVSQ